MSQQKQNKEDYEIDLVEIIKKLWRNRKVITIITGIFMAIGIIYALCATPIYKSTLTMYPASGGEKMGGLMSMAASFGMSTGGSKETYNIEDVVKSRTIAREVVLHKWKTTKYDEPVDLLGFDGKLVKDSVKAVYSAIIGYNKLVSIETNKATGLMKLNVETEDPILCAEIANYLGQAVTKYVQEYQGGESKRNIEHINKRLVEVERELKSVEELIKIFQTKNRDISSPQARLEFGRMQRDLQIKQQVYLTLNQQIELAQIEKIKKSPVINILDKAEVPLYKIKPKGSLIMVIYTFLGGIMGVLFVLIIPFLKTTFGDFKLAKLVKA
jgi:uncharacterized protein involved in exopolysaccharide biosynthesis